MTNLAQQKRPWIVIVGGFLGAGKTSLILVAARLLEQRGMRCGVILNDQGDELVDTQHADAQGIMAREVTGGCFCCRLSGLIEVIEELRSSFGADGPVMSFIGCEPRNMAEVEIIAIAGGA